MMGIELGNEVVIEQGRGKVVRIDTELSTVVVEIEGLRYPVHVGALQMRVSKITKGRSDEGTK